MYVNGNGRGRMALELETVPYSVDNSRILDSQRILRDARQTARQVAPLARNLASTITSILLDTVPGARRSFNTLTIQLLSPWLQKGERYSRQKESELFSIYEANIEIANTGVAYEAALMEVLAAEASHTQSESEAAALIGTTLPLAFRVMDGRQLLHPVIPTLLVATARLVRFLHRHSRGSRRLLRLVPVILRRTLASVMAVKYWGCPITNALISCIMAIQSKRIFGNTRLVIDSITRNALIRFSTVAPI